MGLAPHTPGRASPAPSTNTHKKLKRRVRASRHSPYRTFFGSERNNTTRFTPATLTSRSSRQTVRDLAATAATPHLSSFVFPIEGAGPCLAGSGARAPHTIVLLLFAFVIRGRVRERRSRALPRSSFRGYGSLSRDDGTGRLPRNIPRTARPESALREACR
jgi:hypothetical protein